MTMIAVCPSPDDLKSLSLGKLSEEQSDELFSHVQACTSCMEEISSINETDDTLVGLIQKSANDQVSMESRSIEQETECRTAVHRARAALANIDQRQDSISHVPQMIGEYEVERPLGFGGMGNVYLGRHTKLGRPVAIKVIASHRRWDKSMRDRFESEMRTIGGLNHPNIVAAHDAREVDGMAVLVTELIDGLDASELLRRNGKLDVADAAQIVLEVCQALGYCDQRGLVHRDIKPSNIMVDVNGNVKLLDLGLAKIQADQNADFTATGQAIGTADYVAPEQINDGRNIDLRTDLYGLGCTFFKLLTGNAPFSSSEYATAFSKMNAHVAVTAPSVTQYRDDIPAPIVDLIARMLKKEPAQRPKSIDEVLDTLVPYASNANLAELVSSSKEKTAAEPSVEPTPPVKRHTASSDFWNRNSWLRWVALGLAAMIFGIWLGITITVTKPNGETASVVIPNGATAIVTADGDVEIQLPNGKVGATISKRQVTVDPGFAETDKSITMNVPLTKESEMFNRLERGDRVDIFLTPIDLDDTTFTARRVASNVVVERSSPGKAGQNVVTVRVPEEANEFLDQIARTPDRLKMEIRLHDRQIQRLEDEMAMQGIWKIVIQRIHGRMISRDTDQAMMVYRGQCFMLQPDSMSTMTDSLQFNMNGNLEIIGPKGEKIEAVYRFLPSGRLELAFNDGEASNPPSSYDSAEVFLRLEKLTSDQATLDSEKFGFAMLEKAKDTKRRLDMYLLDPETEKKTGKPVASSSDFVSATAVRDGVGRWAIQYRLTYAAGERMYRITKANYGKKIGVFVDGKLKTAPKIFAAIGSNGVISGDFTEADAKSLADQIVPKLKESFWQKKATANSAATEVDMPIAPIESSGKK